MENLALFVYNAYAGKLSQEDLKDTKMTASEIMRAEMFEKLGIEDGKLDYKVYRRNKVTLFEIIEEVLDIAVGEGITTQFDGLVETRNLALGDKQVFHIESQEMFKVASIADGTSDLRRQKLDNGQMTVGTSPKGIKIYTELMHFLTGRIDWNKMIQKLYDSIMKDKKERIYDTIIKAFDTVSAPYKKSGAFDEVKLVELGSLVEAKAMADGVVVLGTKSALAKIQPALITDAQKEELVRNGYVGMVRGMELREIPQAVKIGTDEFAIADDFLLVLPKGQEEFVKLVDKGQVIVNEASNIEGDHSIDFIVTFEDGIAVIAGHVWGVYNLG